LPAWQHYAKHMTAVGFACSSGAPPQTAQDKPDAGRTV